MPYYRLYQVRYGHFIGARNIHAVDDFNAIAAARLMLGKDEAELWCGSRKVAFLERP